MNRSVRIAFSRDTLWAWYLLAGVVLTSLYAFVPPFAGNGPLINLIGLSSTVAILVAVRLWRPAGSAIWAFMALGQFLFFLGDLYTYSYPRLMDVELPFPSAGDVIYLTVYPALMAGLLLMVRRRNPHGDRAAVVDALILTVGAALLFYVFLIAPTVHTELGAVEKLFSIGYPVGDMLLLAAAIRLAVDGGRRSPAFHLLTASIVALMITDSVYGWMLLNETYTGQVWLDMGWLSYFLLWGAAALHPSMRTLDEPAPDRETRLGRLRLLLLAGASLVAPVLQMTKVETGGVDMQLTVGASIVMFLLVVARMAGLVHQNERSAGRERVLKDLGAELVTAADREAVAGAALEAARALVAAEADVRLCIPSGDGLDALGGDYRRALGLQTAATLAALAAGEAGVATRDLRADLEIGERARQVWVLPLRGGQDGYIVVASPVELSPLLRSSVQALASHVALALETQALTQDLHRRHSEERFATLVQHSSDLITVLGADGVITYQSPSIERVLGYTAEEAIGRRIDELLDPAQRSLLADRLIGDGSGSAGEVVECTLRHRDGSWRHFEILRNNLLADEKVRGIVLNSRDVSERKAFEEQLSHQAFHDQLTDLPNRALFADRVQHALARAARDNTGVGVIFVDLDDFKAVNDSAGHAAGDEVLIEVARRLHSATRPGDTAARFGGDEFAILLEDVAERAQAVEVAERLLAAMSQPVTLGDDDDAHVRASVGISYVEGHDANGVRTDDLMRNADVAMYVAKHEGKNTLRTFEPAMHDALLERLELRADLQKAIDQGQFEVYYQPLVDLRRTAVSGLEALIRWRHPTRGLVVPAQFIPIAEETGLILPIGEWVLREACRHARELQLRFPSSPPLRVSVNLSVKQLQQDDIAGQVLSALEDAGLSPRSLVLEITESAMIADTELAVRRLEELKALGVRLAMDDFGTGYSSLSHLSRFPVDILKMDRSFLRQGEQLAESGLAAAVVALGESLELEVVAEGIEQAFHVNKLRDVGCDVGQGYFFAKPMNLAATTAYLEQLHTVAPSGARFAA